MTTEGSGPDGFLWRGFPRALTREHAETAQKDLTRLWIAQAGNEPGGLTEDLNTMQAKFFNPLSTGARLRRNISDIVDTEPPTKVEEPFVLPIDGGRWLVTPEGRLLLQVIEQALEDGPRETTVVLVPMAIEAAESLALDIYRQLSQRRLRDVIRLDQGAAPPMLPGAIGTVLFLVVNRSIGADKAMPKPAGDPRYQRIDRLQRSVIAAFADTLSPSKRHRDQSQYSLRSGYGLSEASRRLSRLLVADSEKAYIVEGAEQPLLDRVATELVRRGEDEVRRLPEALDALGEAYAEVRPALASLGLAHSRSSGMTALKRDLLEVVAKMKQPDLARERLG